MKHKLLHPSRWGVALLLAVCTVACDTESGLPDTPPPGGDVPVGFSVGVGAPAATRASGELTTANLTSMGVFAYYTGQSNWNAATHTPNFMYNQRVTRSGSAAPWTYTPVKYWPNAAGDKISFFAYAPHTSNASELSPGTAATNAGNPVLYYELDSDADNHTDLLAAPALKNNTKSASSPAFAMKHMMTRILVQVKCEEAIRVTNVVIGSVPYLADLTWDGSGNPVWKEINLVNKTACSSSTATNVPANTDTRVAEFFMLPAATTDRSFDVVFDLNGTTEYKGVDIPDSPLWEMGKTIAYTLNIEVGSEITLSVKEWDTNNDNNGTMGEEVTVPSTGYPFMKNGIIYESPTKSYYVSPVYYNNVLGEDTWGQETGQTTGWYQWDPAKRICRGVHSFGSYGKGEWRLPDRYELANVVKFGLNGSSLWSCTDAGDGAAWKYEGSSEGRAPYTFGHRLLCIRDMQDLTNPTVRSVKGIPVIYLNGSKYMVSGKAEAASNPIKIYSDATSYCSSLNYGGYNSGWRLPTYEEAAWVLNLGVKDGTTYWTSQNNQAILGGYKETQKSDGGWTGDAPAGVAKARTYCVRDY